MDNSIQKDIVMNTYLYANGIVFSPAAFLQLFGKVPHCLSIKQVDYINAAKLFKKKYAASIIQHISNKEVYTKAKSEELVQSVFIMDTALIVEVSERDFEIYYTDCSEATAMQIKNDITGIRQKRKTRDEINILAKGEYGLELSSFEINRTRLDLGLYYEDDFKEVDSIIQKQLNKKNGKGIVLLHGIPGTGKTTYLRYLIGRLKKKVMFVPPSIAGQISSPELVKLLIDNPDTVLVVEDAENIIMQRQAGQDSSVSNILNISDGLLSDFLNVQLICTFNSPLSTVDDALLRKGRLIAKYEFGKLSVPKAQRLSDRSGFVKTIHEPMTLAEILNQEEKDYAIKKQLIGFRTAALCG